MENWIFDQSQQKRNFLTIENFALLFQEPIVLFLRVDGQDEGTRQLPLQLWQKLLFEVVSFLVDSSLFLYNEFGCLG